MGGQKLYLANHWTEFEMLLISNTFLDLIRFLLQSFPPIPQFIAQLRPICLISSIVLPYSFSYRNNFLPCLKNKTSLKSMENSHFFSRLCIKAASRTVVRQGNRMLSKMTLQRAFFLQLNSTKIRISCHEA